MAFGVHRRRRQGALLLSASVLAASALVAISENLQHAQFPEEGDRFPANRNSAAGNSLLDWWEGKSARLSEKLSDHLLRNGVETCRVLTVAATFSTLRLSLLKGGEFKMEEPLQQSKGLLLARIWGREGTLSSVGTTRERDGRFVGKTWRRVGNFLVYHQASSSGGSPPAALAFEALSPGGTVSSRRWYAGHYLPSAGWMLGAERTEEPKFGGCPIPAPPEPPQLKGGRTGNLALDMRSGSVVEMDDGESARFSRRDDWAKAFGDLLEKAHTRTLEFLASCDEGITENTNLKPPPFLEIGPKSAGSEMRGGAVFEVSLFGGAWRGRARLTAGVLDKATGHIHGGRQSVTLKLKGRRPQVNPVLRNVRIKSVAGVLKDGFFHDFVVMETNDGRFQISRVAKNNVLHGPSVLLGVRPLLPRAWEYCIEDPILDNPPTEGGVGFVGIYQEGRLSGPFWVGMDGGGFMHGLAFAGQVEVTAFVYPDHKTALVGSFGLDFVMRSARSTEVQGLQWDSCVPEPVFGPLLQEEDLYYSPPTNRSAGGGPPVPDAYESRTSRAGKSSIPGSGEGLFAVRDIPKGQLTSIYSNFAYRNREEMWFYQYEFAFNKSLSDDVRIRSVMYSGEVVPSSSTSWFYIPPGRESEVLTLAHKVNFQFPELGQNSYMGTLEHPRYGLVSGFFASRDIKAGEEIFADYGDFGGHEDAWPFPYKAAAAFYWEAKARREAEAAEKMDSLTKKT